MIGFANSEMQPVEEDIQVAEQLIKEEPHTKTVLVEEERKRGRRMMGVLLGTLSKFRAEVDPAAQKQQEIQARLTEKIQTERALLAEALEKEKEERLARKAAFREAWMARENEAVETRRVERERLYARFLRTTGDLPLYYLPAKLTDEQQETVKRQNVAHSVTDDVAESIVAPVECSLRPFNFDDDEHDSYDDMSD